MSKNRAVACMAIALLLVSISAAACSGGSSATTLASSATVSAPPRASTSSTTVPSVTSPKTSVIAGLSTTTTVAIGLPADAGPGGTWTEQKVTGDKPAPRVYPSLVYAPNVDRLLLFGGNLLDSNGDLSDWSDELWAYSPGTASWERIQPNTSGPDARLRAAIGYDEKTGQVILFGGVGDSYSNDTWAYDPRANSWTELHPTSTPPGGAQDATMVYDPQSDRMLLLIPGGDNGGKVEVWSLEVTSSSWSKLEPAGPVPPGRSAPSVVYADDLRRIVMIGGTNDNGVSDDIWFFDPASRRWSQKKAPSAHQFVGQIAFGAAQEAAYDARTHLVIFCTTQRSGSNPASYTFKTLAYSPLNDQWTEPETSGAAPPPLLHVATVIYDSSRDAFIFYGGVTGTEHYTFNDGVWIYAPPR